MNRKTIWVMAIACGLAAANFVYSQPLLTLMADDFRSGANLAGYVPTFTLLGVMLGMLAFVPLGDLTERRSLILVMCLVSGASSFLVALSPNFMWLAVASFTLGATSIIPHLVLPFAARLSTSDNRGRVVGSVFSGVLIGLLLARTVSGFVGEQLGWRAVYWMGGALMFSLAALVRLQLPTSRSEVSMKYSQLLLSIWSLVREEPLLRESCVVGSMMFGAFNAFWATLVFFLAGPPYHYGAATAGLFGLVGVVGAIAAPVFGRISDRKGPRFAVGITIGVAVFSFVELWSFGARLWGLIAGTVLVDASVQAGQVCNQTRIYSIRADAFSRVNTAYMVCYFLGASLGSALGTYGWQQDRWEGVCLAGTAMLLIAAAAHIRGARASIVAYALQQSE